MNLFARMNYLVAVTSFDMGDDDPMEILNTQSKIWDSGDANDQKITGVIGDVGVIGIRFIIGAGVILFIICLISILFIRNDVKMLDQKKKEITKIVVTIWLAASAVTIFSTIYALLNNIF